MTNSFLLDAALSREDTGGALVGLMLHPPHHYTSQRELLGKVRLAQRLLREAEGQARWMGVDEMILMVKKGNYAAQSLYEKMGYRKEPRTKDHGSEVCMRKHLYLSMHSLPSMVPQLTFIDTALAARR